MTTPLTPLDPWTRSKIGLPPGRPLTRAALEAYQLEKLRGLLSYIRQASPFYHRLLANLTGDFLPNLKSMANLPFTTAADLRRDGLKMLCVSQSDVARVVTLQSSGTTAQPKRIYFTEEDLDLTVDFFHQGISTFVKPGGRVLICMPGQLPGSVGDLLMKGLARLGATGLVHGPIMDTEAAIRDIVEFRPDCLVGIPAQILALARHEDSRLIPSGCIQNILLSTDYVPSTLVNELDRAWHCRVFNHYGMTEMGLGGAVECQALAGSHPRETDLYFEIINPETGEVLPDGEWGEAVFTTLTRKGMPLLRYRTGDLARFLVEPCPCGSILKRLDKVMGRLESLIKLPGGQWLSISQLDERIYDLPDITGYQAEMLGQAGRDILAISFCTRGSDPTAAAAGIRQAVEQVPAIKKATQTGTLELSLTSVASLSWQTTGPAKRKIIDRRMDRPAEDTNPS